MSNFGEKRRSYKYKLRCKYFYPNKTKQEVADNPPPGADNAHWTAFVEYYFEKDVKKKCHQNGLNRGKLKVPHAGGSRSNARKGRQMEKILKFLPQDQERAAMLGVASPFDAIGKVFGAEHSGSVRGMEIGVSPSTVYEVRGQLNLLRSSSFVNNVAEDRIGDLVKQVGTLPEKLNEYDEIKQCIGELVKQVCTLHEKFNGYDEMKTQTCTNSGELRETKAQLAQNQFQMGGLYKF